MDGLRVHGGRPSPDQEQRDARYGDELSCRVHRHHNLFAIVDTQITSLATTRRGIGCHSGRRVANGSPGVPDFLKGF